MDVSVHCGPGYAPEPLASAIEVVKTPVTGEADFGDAGPWMLTLAAVEKVAVNPGGTPVVEVHSIADVETAERANPYPALEHQVLTVPTVSAALLGSVKFQPLGAISVTAVIA